MSTTPIAEGIFTEGPPARLIGGRHRVTGALVFPRPGGRVGDEYEPCDLPSRGTLWSYTVQHFRPKSPPYAGADPFEPFAVGYVELPGALIVEARLTEVDDGLAIGMPMEARVVPFVTRPDGVVVTTFAFAPVQDTEA